MTKNTPRRNHYLSQFYLRGFTRIDDRLYIYDRLQKEIRTQYPSNTALENNFYNVKLEKALADIEKDTKIVISKIEKNEAITLDDRNQLSLFVALLVGRVPSFKKSFEEIIEGRLKKENKIFFSSIDKIQNILEKLGYSKKSSVSAEDIYNFVHDEKYDLKLSRGYSVVAMVNVAVQASLYFRRLEWDFLFSSDKTAFVTSDTPFCVLPPVGFSGKGVGLTTIGSQKMIPLSRKVCLLMLDPGETYGFLKLPSREVRRLNLIITERCHRFVIGGNENQLRKLVSLSGISEKPWKRDIFMPTIENGEQRIG